MEKLKETERDQQQEIIPPEVQTGPEIETPDTQSGPEVETGPQVEEGNVQFILG
jgi:hypothetical protein